MLSLIASFFVRNWVAQLAFAALLAWGALKGWGAIKYHKGWAQGREVLARDLDKQARAEGEEAEKAQEAAELPGAVERLRKRWCENCK